MASLGVSARPFCAVRPVSSPLARRPACSPSVVICQSYKNKENIDLSKVPAFARHETDTGSSEYQVARLSARIVQISSHLKKNRKDHAAKRGLVALLSQRKSLLQYIYREDRAKYDEMLSSFGIRSVVVGDTRGASRKEDAPAPVSA